MAASCFIDNQKPNGHSLHKVPRSSPSQDTGGTLPAGFHQLPGRQRCSASHRAAASFRSPRHAPRPWDQQLSVCVLLLAGFRTPSMCQNRVASSLAAPWTRPARTVCFPLVPRSPVESLPFAASPVTCGKLLRCLLASFYWPHRHFSQAHVRSQPLLFPSSPARETIGGLGARNGPIRTHSMRFRKDTPKSLLQEFGLVLERH